MKPVVFHPDAVQEAHDAADYYEGKRRGLGKDFRQELDAALARVRQNPQWFAIVSGKMRACTVHRFPFAVYFEELTDKIWIAGVGHQSRRPGYWRFRRPN